MWRPERSARGGSVASGPGAERVQPGTGRGGHLAARGGLARDVGVDCDSGPIRVDRDVQRDVHVDKVVVAAHLRGRLWSSYMVLKTLCSSHAGAHGVYLSQPSEIGLLRTYEG